jgi:cell division septum initiation protein DivIVA
MVHTRRMGDGERERLPRLEDGGDLGGLRTRILAAIRDASFPSAGRGYERRAVDSYVRRVNRLIAELEVGRSPHAAVRHALDRVGQQTESLLHQARETADELRASARSEAEEELEHARAEAEKIVAEASTAGAAAEEVVAKAKIEAGDILARASVEAQDIVARAHGEAEEVLTDMRERVQRLDDEIAASRARAEEKIRELHKEAGAAWQKRRELLDDLHVLGTRILELASEEAARPSPVEAG